MSPKIVGTASVQSPMRRYYTWQTEDKVSLLYVEDVVTGVRYSVEAVDQFHEMREWTDQQWDAWLEIALRTWLNR